MSNPVLEVAGPKLVEFYALQLKKRGEIQLPPWVDYVKLSHAKELGPFNPDWFYFRCASICRKLYLHPHKGLNWFTKKFSANKNRGSRPEHVKPGSKSVIRRCLNQLQAIGVVKNHTRNGRSLTQKGRNELEECARALLEETPQ